MLSEVLHRNNVRLSGQGTLPLVFAHGYGCDQAMWRFVAPAFEHDFRVVLFDHVGAGGSDLSAYDHEKYGQLEGYAADVIEICAALGLRDAVFVGHSVSAMIGVLAAVRSPELFARLILVSPSPRYVNEENYCGGFAPEDIEGLLELLDADQLNWAANMAPVIMGNNDRPELADELKASFCRVDPVIARQFARVTFLGDNRADLPRVRAPSLVLQCSDDPVAPMPVGEYVQRQMPNGRMVTIQVTGHCPHLSAPEETIAAIRDFLTDLQPAGGR